MHEFTASSWITSWQWSWAAAVIVVAMAAGYLAAWIRAGEKRTPIWRLVAYLLLGWGTVAYVTLGPVGVFSHLYLWMLALQVAVLTAVSPLGIALGKPIDLACAATGSDAPRRLASGKLARIAMFPLVSTVLSAVSVAVVMYTGYGVASLRSDWVFGLLIVHLLIVGTLVVLPLLADDLLPSWAGPGMRALIACLDGLVDALPGILVMTSSSLIASDFPGFKAATQSLKHGMSALTDQRYAGGALLGVAESIGIPMVIAVFVEWLCADADLARRTDAELDRAEASGGSTTPWWLEENRR